MPQVDLKERRYVSKILTQGRQDYNQWVTSYKVASSNNGRTFKLYKRRGRVVVMCSFLRTRQISHIKSPFPGARFSKVLKPFRARKAIHKTPTRLFCEAGLFICCKGNKNLNNFVPRDSFVLKIQRELCLPKSTRKVSGISRKRLQECSTFMFFMSWRIHKYSLQFLK